MDPDDREVRMPGVKSILLSPKSGIEGCFDGDTREMLVEVVEESLSAVDAVETLAGELSIIGTQEHADAIRALLDRMPDAVGALEMFDASEDGYHEILAIREARQASAEACRSNLFAAGT